MKRLVVLLGLVMIAATGLVFAEAPAPATGIRAELLWQINSAADKLVELAEATPAEKYSWRPAEGVRSISEVYVHVSDANYLLAQMIGIKPPKPYDEKMEKMVTDKAKIIADLKESMDYLRKLVTDMPDADLDKPADLFGTKTTVRGALFGFIAHMHEHLGQSIAYARSNKVTPPWTAKEQAAKAQEKR